MHLHRQNEFKTFRGQKKGTSFQAGPSRLTRGVLPSLHAHQSFLRQDPIGTRPLVELQSRLYTYPHPMKPPFWKLSKCIPPPTVVHPIVCVPDTFR
jgi:hypothetical protein